MKTIKARMRVAALLFPVVAAPAAAADTYWVASEYVDRRTCPSQACGSVGYLRFKDKVEARETKTGWVRISNQYGAMCSDGRSELVESGNDECTPRNGITKGVFSEWVPVQRLSRTLPSTPSK